MDSQLDRIADALFANAEALRYLADKAYPSKLPRPKPFTLKLISERTENDMDFLTYEATLPPVPANTDIASQDLVVSVDGEIRPKSELPATATTATFEVPQGSNVALTFRYVDDAGNSSPDREQSFVAIDTVPPEAPGPFGEIKVVSERTE